MNGRPVKFSPLALALTVSLAATSAQANTTAAIAGADRDAPYPSFAQVPEIPKNVRTAQAWKAAVVATRAAGARVARLAARTPWTLEDTAAWAAGERAVAAPPPPMTTPADGDTEAFVKAMRARATPPPRSH